ncbi:hypothetical protein V7094_27845 [Priestia megaterium]
MICPQCKKPLHWQSDQDDGERCYGHYTCDPCNIEVLAYFNDSKEGGKDE